MTQKDCILNIVYQAIDSINTRLPVSEQVEKLPSTILYGMNGSLDSMGVIELLMQVQELIYDEFGIPVAVAGEEMLFDDNVPVQTIESLVEHVGKALADEQRK